MTSSLPRRLGFFVLSAALLAGSACSRSGNDGGAAASPPPPAAVPGGPVTSPAELDAIVDALADRCLAVTDDATTEATLTAARAAYARGDTDIPLSVQGCTRMFVQRSGGDESYAAVFGPPFGFRYDPVTFEVKKTASMISWSTGADGRREVRGDLDADGIYELSETVVPEVSMVSQRTTPSGEVKQRTTAKVGAGGLRLEITEESADEGTLGVTAKYESARVARKCTTDPPPGAPPPPSSPPKPASPFPPSPHEVPCTGEQLQKLETLLVKATEGGEKCMAGTGMLDVRFRLLRQMATTSFDFKCTDDGSFIAANDGGYGGVFPGRALLWINPTLFSAVEAEQVATIYHELLHFFFGHDHDMEALADGADMVKSDQVYACEYLCFAKKPNTCHLAACTKKKICQVDRSAFEQKTGKELESCWTGHQVGALCRKGAGERQWCTTKAECDAACGGQECESKSISCDEDCR